MRLECYCIRGGNYARNDEGGGRLLGSTEFRGPVERIRAQTVEFVANKQMPRRFKDDGNSIARLFDFQSDAE